MQRIEFEKLVEEAIQELPQEFRDRLCNVAVIVEDRPSRALLRRMGVPPGETLFGLYEGTPLTERNGAVEPLYPDRILIFQEPIEEEFTSPDEIREQVQITIMHEVAHFFGIDDEYLHDIGYD